jgi:hypothetical protein
VLQVILVLHRIAMDVLRVHGAAPERPSVQTAKQAHTDHLLLEMESDGVSRVMQVSMARGSERQGTLKPVSPAVQEHGAIRVRVAAQPALQVHIAHLLVKQM